MLAIVIIFNNNLNDFAALENVRIYPRTIDDGVEGVLARCEGCVEGRDFGRNVGVIAKNNNAVCC